eukprot:3723552-Amphidinium_carterae.1
MIQITLPLYKNPTQSLGQHGELHCTNLLQQRMKAFEMDDTSRATCALHSPSTADNTRLVCNIPPSVETAQVFSCRIPWQSKPLLSFMSSMHVAFETWVAPMLELLFC